MLKLTVGPIVWSSTPVVPQPSRSPRQHHCFRSIWVGRMVPLSRHSHLQADVTVLALSAPLQVCYAVQWRCIHSSLKRWSGLTLKFFSPKSFLLIDCQIICMNNIGRTAAISKCHITALSGLNHTYSRYLKVLQIHYKNITHALGWRSRPLSILGPTQPAFYKLYFTELFFRTLSTSFINNC